MLEGEHIVKITGLEFTPAVVMHHEDGGTSIACLYAPQGKWQVIAFRSADPEEGAMAMEGELDMAALLDTLDIEMPAWVEEGAEWPGEQG